VAEPSHLASPHWHNAGGSHDSIRVNRFRTVSSVRDEIELEEIEKKHVCATFDLSCLYGGSL
jgi:hypothetical protein